MCFWLRPYRCLGHLGPDRIARVRAALSAESIKICRWQVGGSTGSPWDGPERTGHSPSTRGDCTHILELCQSEIYEPLGASTLGYACLLGAHEQSLESISLQAFLDQGRLPPDQISLVVVWVWKVACLLIQYLRCSASMVKGMRGIVA